MKNLNIAVIGGTGKSGKFVVQQLLQYQFNLKLLLRNPANFNVTNSKVELLKGDVRDYDSVNYLIKGCDVVVSTLGQPKGESSIFSNATQNVLKAMRENEIRRYILTTGLNVDSPFDTKNDKVKLATKWMYDNFPETTEDKQLEYEILSRSDVDWTLIRLPLITETYEELGYHADLKDCKGDSISALDLGRFIVDEIVNENFIKKSPFLFNL